MKKYFLFASVACIFTVIFSYSAPTKQVVAESSTTRTVCLGGEAFGIKMFSDGVLVIDTEDTLPGTDTPSPALAAGIKVNDIIKSVNGKNLCSNEEFTDYVTSYSTEPLKLVIERNDECFETNLIPQYDAQGILRAGMWIKDSAAGIGTVTYYDMQTKSFGALGHGICESSTGKLIPISYGEIASAKINDITKSEDGNVGSLNGYFDGEVIGKARLNCEYGIFGDYLTEHQEDVITICDKKDVRTGNAEIFCTLSNNQKASYDIKIKKLSHYGDDTMLIEVTDPELLETTGGIVQGMSGSPIVQNGKLVGAVTHVLVNNVKCGYGIYIEDMLDKSA